MVDPGPTEPVGDTHDIDVPADATAAPTYNHPYGETGECEYEIAAEALAPGLADYSDIGLPLPPEVDHGGVKFIPLVPMISPPELVKDAEYKFVRANAQYEFVNRGQAKSVCDTSLDELIHLYGFGFFVYFDVLRMAMAFTVLVFCLQIIPYAWYLDDEQPGFDEHHPFNRSYADLFISDYSKSQENPWYGVNIATIVIAALFPVAVWFRIDYRRGKCVKHQQILERDRRLERLAQDRIMRYREIDKGEGRKIAVEDPTEEWSLCSKVLRIIIAFAAFAGMVGITVIFSYYGTRQEDEESSNTTFALSIAILVQILNSAYFTVGYMTTFAMPVQTWTGFSQIYAAKLILFRVSQNIAVFAAKRYKTVCAYYTIGEQFFFILLIDLTLGNVLEVIGPWFVSKAKFFLHQHTSLLVGSTKMDLDPQFHISVEYLELFGRMYVLLMAVIVFPFASVLTILGLAIDYWLDKWRLMRLAAVQQSRLEGKQKSNVAGMLFLAALFAFLTPVAGTLWVLIGVTADACTECTKCAFP
eukprot:TRINITY_DN16840_c0_g1_i1.p1 TRINITY_DN16840_c0_g1~~TRINITY_DN16840_c0_g1_i1.p1  ORF type:complete len:552 (+),score=235.34 TRINITY_DN16840_c0_g1_i1:70-1656(+)